MGIKSVAHGGYRAFSEQAAGNEHLEDLKWACANVCKWDPLDYGICQRAAFSGHLEVLKWASANGCEWHTTICANAAHCGHFELLQWACANGRGHLEVLKWARENGRPWDSYMCSSAAAGGHLAVLRHVRTAAPGTSMCVCLLGHTNGAPERCLLIQIKL